MVVHHVRHRVDLRRDYARLHWDEASWRISRRSRLMSRQYHEWRAAERERADIYRDRVDLRRDYRDLRRDGWWRDRYGFWHRY